MSRESTEQTEQAQGGNADARPAGQMETRPRTFEQKIDDLQAQAERRSEELATAEAQRDEAISRLTAAENRLSADRMLAAAGVVDVETASLLLSGRVDLDGETDTDDISRAVEQLLVDKPFLLARQSAPLPPKTASAKGSDAASAAQLAEAAEIAARTGDRRHVAEYLRLRRRISLSRAKV